MGIVHGGWTMTSKGRQIISAEALVKGQDGKVLAHGTSTLLVLPGAENR